ncbi:MAG: hypothetical protein GX657_18915, partial [Chloroflexi bacterium]|nr:hypothetical protein [Chloroflexota bacterium]
MGNGRDVVDCLLRNKPAERVALRESPWADTISAWVQQGYPTQKVYKEVGEERWCPEDGGTVDVEVAGEYVEPL